MRTSPRSTAATRSSTDSVLASGRRTSSIEWAIMDDARSYLGARTGASGTRSGSAPRYPGRPRVLSAAGSQPRDLASRSSERGLQAGAAAGAMIGDRAIARVGRVRRLQDVLVVDDLIEARLGLGAVLRGGGLERLEPVLAGVERAVVIGVIPIQRPRRVRAVQVTGVTLVRRLIT